MMQDTILKTHELPHEIDDVWRAISSADQISEWFIQADFKAEVGYQYTFRHQTTVITGEVLACQPVFELVYTWIVQGTDVTTTVSWHLESSASGTRLTLEHSGISNYPGETAMVMFENFKGGWESCIVNLSGYLSKRAQ